MKSSLLVLILSFSILSLTACGKSEEKQVEKETVKKNIMGDGNIPMPKLSDYKNEK